MLMCCLYGNIWFVFIVLPSGMASGIASGMILFVFTVLLVFPLIREHDMLYNYVIKHKKIYKINAIFLCGYIYYPYLCSVEREQQCN